MTKNAEAETTDIDLVDRLAKIIDPEAFGMSEHDLGEYGMSDRDEARMKARLVIAEMERAGR